MQPIRGQRNNRDKLMKIRRICSFVSLCCSTAWHHVKQEPASVMLPDNKKETKKEAVSRTGSPVHLIQPPLLVLETKTFLSLSANAGSTR